MPKYYFLFNYKINTTLINYINTKSSENLKNLMLMFINYDKYLFSSSQFLLLKHKYFILVYLSKMKWRKSWNFPLQNRTLKKIRKEERMHEIKIISYQRMLQSNFSLLLREKRAKGWIFSYLSFSEVKEENFFLF